MKKKKKQQHNKQKYAKPKRFASAAPPTSRERERAPRERAKCVLNSDDCDADDDAAARRTAKLAAITKCECKIQ